MDLAAIYTSTPGYNWPTPGERPGVDAAIYTCAPIRRRSSGSTTAASGRRLHLHLETGRQAQGLSEELPMSATTINGFRVRRGYREGL